jgi:pimeloyl-ACP methyl ester carboxylesterase
MMVHPVRDERVLVNDLSLHVVQWGTSGPPVIFIHGLTANAFCFQTFADELSSDHRVIAYDLRGRGDSDKPATGYNIPAHVADLAKLIDTLEVEQPIIVGHSLGALIALSFAAFHPHVLQKLVLIDAGAPLAWSTIEDQPAWLTAAVARLGTPHLSLQTYIQALKQAPFLGPYWNEAIDLYFQHDVAHQSDGTVVSKTYRGGIIEEGVNTLQFRYDEQWARVTVPTLLLRAGHGLFFDDDQLLSTADAQAIQQGIAQCRYVNYPSLNHYTIIFGTEPGPAQAIRQFIDKDVV